MRVAYADPPYPGQAQELYGEHDDYAGEVDHAELVARLENEYPDGWALSTSSTALQYVLSLCPPPAPNPKRPGAFRDGVRIAAWCKPMATLRPGLVTYAWEPLIWRGGRKPPKGVPTARDYLLASPETFHTRSRVPGHVVGTKPRAFAWWLFELLGLEPGDELADLYPGSGSIGRELDAYYREPRLDLAGDQLELASSENAGKGSAS